MHATVFHNYSLIAGKIFNDKEIVCKEREVPFGKTALEVLQFSGKTFDTQIDFLSTFLIEDLLLPSQSNEKPQKQSD